MIRGLYTAVSAMITNQQKQNVVVNNLANMDTNGYKSKQLLTKSFDELKLEGYNNYA
ncbi:flagellar basal body protein, partial [Clostridioides difficile]